MAEQIARDWILGQGSKRLPSERALAAFYHVTRPTIALALRFMEERGMLLRKVGRGTFSVTNDVLWKPFAGKAVSVAFSMANYILLDPFCANVLAGISGMLMQRGLSLRLQTRDWRFHRQAAPEVYFASEDTVGIFLFGPPPADVLCALKKLRKPLVAIDFDATADGSFSYCFDNAGAGALLARRLHKLGHRRLAALFESPQKSVDRQDLAWGERRRGFLTEVARLQMAAPSEVFLEQRTLHLVPSQDWAQVSQLLRRPAAQRPTAIFSPHPGFSKKVKGLAEQEGLAVPRELTLVNCGNSTDDDEFTAIRFDGVELGAVAAGRMLFHLSHGYANSYSEPAILRLKGAYVAGKTHAHAPRLPHLG